MGPQNITAQVELRDRVVLPTLVGELGLATAPTLIERLRALENGDASVVMLDLRNVTFVDSTGVGALLEARDRTRRRGHHMVCIGVSAAVRSVLEVAASEFVADEPDAARTLLAFSRAGPKATRRQEDVVARG